MADVVSFTFVQRRSTPAEWAASSRILLEGEMGVELGTNKFKIGDGVSTWSNLEYYVSESGVAGYIAEALADIGVGDTELPDLTLLWDNAKT